MTDKPNFSCHQEFRHFENTLRDFLNFLPLDIVYGGGERNLVVDQEVVSMAMKHHSISIAHKIKEFIGGFEPDHIFATQDLLRLISFGSRNSIDLTLSRLVKNKVIKRLARGVFAKAEAAQAKITPHAVATVKAKAFGKSIQLSGEDAAHRVGIIKNNLEYDRSNLIDIESKSGNFKSDTETIYTFYTSGCSSSFKFGNSTIKFIAANQRKRELPNDISGMVLKAVWHFGRSMVPKSTVKAKYIAFNQQQDKKVALRKYIRTVPNWIAKSLYRALA